MTNPTIPDANNVYGHVVALQGLHPVLQAVRRFVGENCASIYTSQFNRAETLHFCTEKMDFESIPIEGSSRHLLNGGVSGSIEDVVAIVREMSRLFAEAGIEHSFEVYDYDKNLVQNVPSR